MRAYRWEVTATPIATVVVMRVLASAPEADWWEAVRLGRRLGVRVWCAP